ncbi:MAG TPA: hypothetical protein VH475_17855 [Tepidisphaeraceae bacterium]|jgi:hypothetical protein
MSHEIRIIPGHEFIRLDAAGNLDLRTSRELLSDIAAKCVANQVDRVLIDVRSGVSDLRPIDLYELALTFPELGFERQDRLAILHRPGSVERASLFAANASHRGWHVRAFDSFEPAFEWLNEEEAGEA